MAQLIGDDAFRAEAPPRRAAEKSRSRTAMSVSVVQRPDLPAKMTGRHTYVQDLRAARNAACARDPAACHRRHTCRRGSEARLRNIPGARVVRVKDFLAVVADREWNAIRAARALRVRWTGGGGLPGSDRVHATLRTAARLITNEHIGQARRFRGALLRSGGARILAASYEWPVQSHASMGPSCAVGDYKRDGVSSSGRRHRALIICAQVVARGLAMPAEHVRVVYLDGAGCYGIERPR